jgi:tetratricopeptide (TPR) repeat protein
MFQQRTAAFLVGILCLPTYWVFAQTAGPGHSEFRELVQQADQLYVQQRYAEAEAKYREDLRLPESAVSEEARGRIRCNLGLVAAGLGHYGEAEPMLKDCPASTPAERFVAWTNLAALYSRTNRYAEADRLFLQAYNLARQDGGITPIQRTLLTENMACHALTKGNYREAEPLLREARDFYAKTGSAWDSANATGNLGVALVKEGRLEDARAEMERAIHETEALGGPSHPMLAGLLGALASVDNRQGRFRRCRVAAEARARGCQSGLSLLAGVALDLCLDPPSPAPRQRSPEAGQEGQGAGLNASASGGRQCFRTSAGIGQTLKRLAPEDFDW